MKRPPVIELLTAVLAVQMIYETGRSAVICIRNLAAGTNETTQDKP